MILYEKHEKESKKEYAYRILKENIMSLELKPGELLSEVELSEKLDLSRTPIREVLMRLKNEHLIEVKPQSGTYVSLIDLDLIEEALFMRFALEEKVIKEACEYFPQDKIIELEKNIFAQNIIASMEGGENEFHKLDTSFHETLFLGVKKKTVWESILNISTHYNRMRLLSQKKDSKNEFHKLDTSFHETLFLGVKKKTVWESILNISTHYNRMRLLSQKKDSKALVVKQHEEILNTIKNKDKDKVESLINYHMKYSIQSWEYLTKLDEENSKYFKKNEEI